MTSYSLDPGTGLFSGTALSTATLAANAQPMWAAMDPTGQLLLVTDLYNEQLDGLSVAAGALTKAGTAPTGINPMWVVVDVTSSYAYTADSGGGVSIFGLSPSSGGVTALGQATPTPASGPDSIAIDPTGGFIYTVSYGAQSETSYSIGAGALAQSGTTASVGYYPQVVVVDPTGRFLYVGNYDGTISSFQVASGRLSGQTSTSSSQNPVNALAFDPTGKYLYGANNSIVPGDVSQWSLSATTGALTSLGANLPCGAGAWAIVVNQSGGSVYVSNSYDDTITVFQANLATGVLATTPSGTIPLPAGSAPEGLAVSR